MIHAECLRLPPRSTLISADRHQIRPDARLTSDIYLEGIVIRLCLHPVNEREGRRVVSGEGHFLTLHVRVQIAIVGSTGIAAVVRTKSAPTARCVLRVVVTPFGHCGCVVIADNPGAGKRTFKSIREDGRRK